MSDDVDDFLAHYGVKGMKWGRRKGEDSTPKVETKRKSEDLSVTLKSGATLELKGDKTYAITRALAALSPKIQERVNASDSFTFKDPNGKTVGGMFLDKKSPDELNVVWISVKEKHQGQGYASGAMQAAVGYAKKEGMKKVTLEVPGNAPDARHIYEKLGFQAGAQITQTNDMWGGLTKMQLDL